ncbi:MAG: hypothetical protein ACK44B_07740 [Flavobacteriales bacterium]
MLKDYQSEIFEIIKRKLKGNESIGNLVGDILYISQDAAYRRYRCETQLTIYELEKLSKHFDISLDSLFGKNKSKVLFDFQPLSEIDFSMDSYLERYVVGLKTIKAHKNPEMIITVNNTPLFQLLNFPHLIRFKLFFWAKTHLQVKEFQNVLFKYEKISDSTFNIGKDILFHYNTIPSKELYDPELLRGFAREIYYYYNAHQFEDPSYAIILLNTLEKFLEHLKDQAARGKKFIYGTQAPASGNAFEMYHNETFNAATTIYYRNDEYEGIHFAHNLMNSLHTTDPIYIADSLGILKKQLANSSMISIVNEKERNSYFHKVSDMISGFRKKIELDLSTNSM